MVGKRVLVPFNFTDYDERALHYVIRTFAGQERIFIMLFHVYTPLPELDGYSSPSLGRLKSTIASMWQEVREKEKDLKRVKEDLVENGFHESQIAYQSKPGTRNLGAEIVEMARHGDYDIVVISQKPRKASRAFRRKVHDVLLSGLVNTEIVIIT
ncbi:MAG: universal stress protein [Proteobacteria bacterium]|nr:universal stress protein [Pseudomonadota bacterium]MBU1904097.1 universal stress protein [Pseudomonadota bacterium]